MTQDAVNELTCGTILTIIIIGVVLVVYLILRMQLVRVRDNSRVKRLSEYQEIKIPENADVMLFRRVGNDIVVAFEGPFKPKGNEKYYYYTIYNGNIFISDKEWLNDNFDIDKLESENVFLTREAATKFAENLQAMKPGQRRIIKTSLIRRNEIIQD